MEPPTKQQKSIPANPVLHIYREKNSHLSIAIGQLIAGAFLFGVRSFKYTTTTKRENKVTYIMQKGDTKFFIKQRKLTHSRSHINSSEKVFLTIWTQKNGVRNATATQWQTCKHLSLVQI